MCVTVWAKKADWPIEYITATQHRSSGKKSKKETEKNWIQHSMVTGHQRVLYVYLVWKRAMNQCCTCVCEFNDMQGNGPSAWLQQQEQQRTRRNNAMSINSRATDQRSYNWIVQSVQKVCVFFNCCAAKPTIPSDKKVSVFSFSNKIEAEFSQLFSSIQLLKSNERVAFSTSSVSNTIFKWILVILSSFLLETKHFQRECCSFVFNFIQELSDSQWKLFKFFFIVSRWKWYRSCAFHCKINLVKHNSWAWILFSYFFKKVWHECIWFSDLQNAER